MSFYKRSFLCVSEELRSVGYHIFYDDRKRIGDKFYIIVYVNTLQSFPSFESWSDAYTWLCGFKACVDCHSVI